MSDDDMNELIAAIERELGGSWRDVVEVLRDHNSLDQIAERVRVGDLHGAVQGVEDAVAAFAADVHAGYVTAGQATAKWLDGELPELVRFDAQHPQVAAWAQQTGTELIREVTHEQRELVQRIVADGVRAGENPLSIARDIRQAIGLTDFQAQIVANYRRALEAGDYAAALGRQLTDGRMDRTIAAAARAERTLTDAQIDAMVDRYRAKWVAFRAETIARTESLRAVHAGQTQLLNQAVADGNVDADRLVRQWNHSSVGKAPRASHQQADGQRRKLGEPFEMGDGTQLAYPGDPNAGPEDTLNCKCVLSTRLS
jgi:hypothetical protein